MESQKQILQVEVRSAIYNVGAAFESLLKNYKIAAADGFQAGQDLPAILLGSMQDLMRAVGTADQVDDNFRDDIGQSINGALIPIISGLSLLFKK